ncbi:SusD/RagB family nutrient-binding outer membrane lipoprotein [Niastella caeni]|uniref:SusD/RagB family nutrient-binding outer membrane lipoprotein n=1 Tax=Niastella caeni TaxID=2569763 RepID=A0A4V4H155_9BACT|nr:SusD/RagB family nutrient-binding outer membrane lipoprotein [Niastella caeni]THU39236.1 SusD/RagB family nutrient-binding outer membrane lipoprotein [Niastella caeni]
MKLTQYIPVLAVALLAVTGCKKSFDDMNKNENKPISVPASLLLNGILYNMYEGPSGMKERWCQYYCCNYDYYGNNRYDFGAGDNNYITLKNVVKMQEEANKGGAAELNPYAALAKFFKAYFFTKMSLAMGDMPMAEALLGAKNLTPVYDAQKNVFLQSLQLLDSANTDLGKLIAANDATLDGDFYYDNKLTKWQKLVNTYRLRLLIHLSKRTDDADLNVKQQFATILSNKLKYPLMEDASDNLQFTYVHPTNDYPMSPDNFGFDALRYNMSATYVDLLTQLKDPRVFVTAEPAAALVSAGKSPASHDAYVGASPGEDIGAMYIKANGGQYSLINRRHFYETYTAEPSIQIGFAEMCFNIAEAINRGWVSSGPLGTAEDHYKAGIKTSLAFYNIPENGTFDAFFLKSGSPGSANVVYDKYAITANFNTYYTQTAVAYAGNNATGLTQILNQRYLALFRHSGLESYFTYRRTGVPNFTTGPGTGNSARIALRFQYPSSEKTANTINYNQALKNQFSGNDDINGVMWIIK